MAKLLTLAIESNIALKIINRAKAKVTPRQQDFIFQEVFVRGGLGLTGKEGIMNIRLMFSQENCQFYATFLNNASGWNSLEDLLDMPAHEHSKGFYYVGDGKCSTCNTLMDFKAAKDYHLA